jgi:hypothetical protein
MKLSVAAGLLLIVAFASAQQSAAQAPTPVPERSESPIPSQFNSVLIDEFSLDANTFIEALLKISAQFQLPLGVEWVKTADTLQPVRFSRTNTSLEEVIQSVVSMRAGYDWRNEAGVVHVFQRDLIKDNRNPLNVTIQSFDERAMTVGWAYNDLDQMVSHVVRHPDLYGISASVLGYPGEPVFRFSAVNAPARNILNQIVKLPPAPPNMKQVWIATFPERSEFSRTGFFEVVPMWNPKFVPEQPFWILLRWGDPPLENMVK